MIVNGEEVEIDYPAYMSGKYSLMPVRAVVEQFYSGYDADWDGDVFTMMFAGTEYVFTVGSEEYTIDGETYTLGAEVECNGDELFIPLRPLANILDVTPSWDNSTMTATFKQ